MVNPHDAASSCTRLPFSAPHVRAPYPLLLVLGSIFLLTVFSPTCRREIWVSSARATLWARQRHDGTLACASSYLISIGASARGAGAGELVETRWLMGRCSSHPGPRSLTWTRSRSQVPYAVGGGADRDIKCNGYVGADCARFFRHNFRGLFNGCC
jgi:hypothetical protein